MSHNVIKKMKLDISNQDLTTLQGVDCSNNRLTSLQYCPEGIQKKLNCSHNRLISLQYFPEGIK